MENTILNQDDDLMIDVKSHYPLRRLIQEKIVTQNSDGDWERISYSPGTTNSPDFMHWLNTGEKLCWCIEKWKSDTDLDETDTSYSIETKEGWNKKYFKVQLNNHFYSRISNSNDDFWVETVERTDIFGGYGEEQLYYRDSLGTTSGKMPVKIGKKIQELRDKEIEFGFYKF